MVQTRRKSLKILFIYIPDKKEKKFLRQLWGKFKFLLLKENVAQEKFKIKNLYFGNIIEETHFKVPNSSKITILLKF